MGNAMNYITKGIGGFYYVKTPDGIKECKARGIFRKSGIKPVAGDWVELSPDGTVIDEIRPRKTCLCARLLQIWMCCSLWQAPCSLCLVPWCWTSWRRLPFIKMYSRFWS